MFTEPVESVIWDNNTGFFWVDGGIWEVLSNMSESGQSVVLVVLTAGFPREHFVIAWKSVDLPTFARPTIPLFKLLPGRPSRIFSSLTAFLGGIFFFLDE